MHSMQSLHKEEVYGHANGIYELLQIGKFCSLLDLFVFVFVRGGQLQYGLLPGAFLAFSLLLASSHFCASTYQL